MYFKTGKRTMGQETSELIVLLIQIQGGAVITGAVAEDIWTLLWKRGLPHPLV